MVEPQANLLKTLLRQRHLQAYSAFCREYDKVALKTEPVLKGRWPSKAQFYRWLSGELISLPHADHCRILEAMLPPHGVEALFAPYNAPPKVEQEPERRTDVIDFPIPSPVTFPIDRRYADTKQIFVSRSDFMHELPPGKLFDGVREICITGLSNNLICQQYSDRALVDALEDGVEIRALFLDPEGEHIKARELEEGHPPGVLSTLTSLNIQALRRLKSKVSGESVGELGIRTYDEPIRFNIIIIDQATAVVQPYLPNARGVESPTMLIEKDDTWPKRTGLFETFSQVFESMWERGKEIS
ncbi:DUF5919 domain-containing protein [Crossiella sp. S99.1]|uniref:DUF5919 domain-containing protein n=1 Tax=Crossiella sp. S99.1 TaxID=2936271 RepID=UPI001FFFB77B|nr:DUF5919 domain-containing protein [Crossiella sp. S99.1]MCK2257046.1 DUF5919 domain-containing protein [Crossiella sp. S99.1]